MTQKENEPLVCFHGFGAKVPEIKGGRVRELVNFDSTRNDHGNGR